MGVVDAISLQSSIANDLGYKIGGQQRGICRDNAAADPCGKGRRKLRAGVWSA
jgi:hypothetical protein